MMNFVLTTRNFVSETRNCVAKTKNYVLKMMDFAVRPQSGRGGRPYQRNPAVHAQAKHCARAAHGDGTIKV